MVLSCKIALTLLVVIATVAMTTEAQTWSDSGLAKEKYKIDKRDFTSSDLYNGEFMNDNIHTKSMSCIKTLC